LDDTDRGRRSLGVGLLLRRVWECKRHGGMDTRDAPTLSFSPPHPRDEFAPVDVAALDQQMAATAWAFTIRPTSPDRYGALACFETIPRVPCVRRLRCLHRSPTALAPWIIRWGADASSDMLRRSARHTAKTHNCPRRVPPNAMQQCDAMCGRLAPRSRERVRFLLHRGRRGTLLQISPSRIFDRTLRLHEY
jgi:hypothetical protein